MHKLGAVAAGMKTALCKVPYECRETGSPCFEELTSESRCPILLLLCLELKLPSWAARCLPYGHRCLTPLFPVHRTLRWRTHTHCEQEQRLCFCCYFPRVSFRPASCGVFWALGSQVDLCKITEWCYLPAHGGPAPPNKSSTPPFAEDSVLWCLWRQCAEQRASAPTQGTTDPATSPCLSHINSWEWLFMLSSCESAGKKRL